MQHVTHHRNALALALSAALLAPLGAIAQTVPNPPPASAQAEPPPPAQQKTQTLQKKL